jgi:hypothetical protein
VNESDDRHSVLVNSFVEDDVPGWPFKVIATNARAYITVRSAKLRVPSDRFDGHFDELAILPSLVYSPLFLGVSHGFDNFFLRLS